MNIRRWAWFYDDYEKHTCFVTDDPDDTQRPLVSGLTSQQAAAIVEEHNGPRPVGDLRQEVRRFVGIWRDNAEVPRGSALWEDIQQLAASAEISPMQPDKDPGPIESEAKWRPLPSEPSVWLIAIVCVMAVGLVFILAVKA